MIVACRPGIATAVSIVPFLIEVHYGGLNRDTLFLYEGALHRANPVLSFFHISRFQHHLVIFQVKVTMKEHQPKSSQAIVLFKDKADLLQALCITLINRFYITDMIQCTPLN